MAASDQKYEKEESSLKQMYDEALVLFKRIENTTEPTNSEFVQTDIRNAISLFEKSTNLVSLTGMFSKNENIEELPTETLQYLLLPMYLGMLTMKLTKKDRRQIIDIADVYFRDFLQRCKDYGATELEPPKPSTDKKEVQRELTNEQKINLMVQTREEKLNQYKIVKALKEKLKNLSKAMESPSADESDKRAYFLTLLEDCIYESLDSINTIQQERPLLEIMEKMAKDKSPKKPHVSAPLKPVIITRDAAQKAVYGLGYPSIPTMSIEEFYDKRVREGTFPASGSNIPHTTIKSSEVNADDQAEIDKERLVEQDDPDELRRQRNMDEYKDNHRRGWGNRHNRS